MCNEYHSIFFQELYEIGAIIFPIPLIHMWTLRPGVAK